VSSVQRADFSVADLDMRAILGEAMHTIAESLGIDVQQEVAGPKLQVQLLSFFTAYTWKFPYFEPAWE
jgi:hypothetical protein